MPPMWRRRGGYVLSALVLVDRFTQLYGKPCPGFTHRALWTLEGDEWPGNVRELENVVGRGELLVDDGQRIGTEHLPSELLKAQDASIGVSRGGSLVRKPTASYEKMLEEIGRAHV